MLRIGLLVGMLAWCAAAQPPVIRVVRTGLAQPYPADQVAVNVIGMSPVSGAGEAWLVELHDSFASIEDADKAVSSALGPVIPSWNTLAGSFRPDLSYRAQEAVQNLPKMRYVDAVTYHVQPGERGDFEKFLKARRAAMNSANLDRPDMVYQIISGEPVGTFIAITPLPSLRVFDDAKPLTPVYAEGDQAIAAKVASTNEFFAQHVWFRLDPRISHVSDDFGSADAAFWRSAK